MQTHKSIQFYRLRYIRLAWFLVGLTLLCGFAGTVLFALNRTTSVPASWGAAGGPRSDLVDLLNALLQAVVMPVIAAALGVLIVRRQHGNRIAWLLLLTGLSSAAAIMTGEWAVYSHYTLQTPLPLSGLAAWVTNWAWIAIYTLLLLMIAIFPEGRFLSPRWRWLIGVPLLLFSLPFLIAGAMETPMSSAYGLPNPFVAENPQVLYDRLFALSVPMMPLTAIAVLAEVLVRFGRARGIERQQIKWLLAGVGLLVMMVVVGLVLALGLDLHIGDFMVNISSLAPLLGIGVALLRYRLYDIDVIIRKTLVYAILTALLALIYVGSIIVLQRIFTALAGQQSDLAIVISTLVIAALFSPLRARMQTWIDRRFYRRRYNAEKALEAFAAAARDEVDVEMLHLELLNVIGRTVQPAHVSVWNRELNTLGAVERRAMERK